MQNQIFQTMIVFFFFTLKYQHQYDFDHFISINIMQHNSLISKKGNILNKIQELKNFPDIRSKTYSGGVHFIYKGKEKKN
jgi:hypothetical protein